MRSKSRAICSVTCCVSLISHLAGCLLSARVARSPDKLPVWLKRDVTRCNKLRDYQVLYLAR